MAPTVLSDSGVLPRTPARPALPSAAYLPNRASLRWLAVFAFIYLYSFPYFEKLWSANEVPRVFMTQEIADHHHLWIDARISGEALRHKLDLSRTPDGHIYPDKAPGMSFLAIPVYLAARLFGHPSIPVCTWLFRVFIVTVPALVFLPFFLGMARRFAPDATAYCTALVAYALGSPAMVYSILFISHQPAAVCVGGLFLAAVALARRESTRPLRTAFLAGLLAGFSVLLEYQSVLAVLVIGIYFVVRVPNRVRAVSAALLGALPPAASLCAYHKLAFGSPFRTGYAFVIQPMYQGFMGLVGPSVDSFWITLFLPSNGLFTLAPWAIFALVGVIAVALSREARARCGAETVVCVAVPLVYVVFLGSADTYQAHAGWSVGPRYMTAALPFVAWLAAAGFRAVDRFAPARVLAQALVVSSVIVFVTAATTYPHWPDQLRNPLHELAFPLLAHGYAVHSLGTFVGLHGFLSIAPLYAIVLGAVIWLLSRGFRRSVWQTALACILAAGLVAGHRTFPSTADYARRTWAFVTATWEPPLR
jgi:hypothetical protein